MKPLQLDWGWHLAEGQLEFVTIAFLDSALGRKRKQQ